MLIQINSTPKSFSANVSRKALFQENGFSAYIMKLHFSILKLCFYLSCVNFKINFITYGNLYNTAVSRWQQHNAIKTIITAEIFYSLPGFYYLLKSLLCAAFYHWMKPLSLITVSPVFCEDLVCHSIQVFPVCFGTKESDKFFQHNRNWRQLHWEDKML